MENIFKFDISGLIKKSTGTKENYSVEGEGVKAKVEIMRIEDGFNVIIENLETNVESECEKCVKKYMQKVEVGLAERQFHIDPPQDIDDSNDLFVIDKKNLEIDISEVVRQEIILHFPANLVCSTHCKGICPICGQDRNKEMCDCKEENPMSESPLSKLKDLIK